MTDGQEWRNSCRPILQDLIRALFQVSIQKRRPMIRTAFMKAPGDQSRKSLWPENEKGSPDKARLQRTGEPTMLIALQGQSDNLKAASRAL